MPLDHFTHLSRLLDLEAAAEQQQTLENLQRRFPAQAEATGQTLANLILRDEDSGLGGRVLLTFARRAQGAELPWTRLGVGSPVILTEMDGSGPAGESWRGVISRISRESVQVAFNQWPEPAAERPTFRLDLSSDEIARQRQKEALDRVRRASGDRLATLRDVLLGRLPPAFTPLPEAAFLDPGLNPSQQAAVRFALSAEDVAVLHGPPGTGKTRTAVEFIRQAVRRGETVLACAPSNLAVDNLLERLVAAGEKVIRLGHPARVLPQLQAHTLDVLVESHPDVRLANKLARQARSLREDSFKYTRARPEPGARQAMRAEAKEMLAEARKIEDQVVGRLLDGARVVCSTATGLDARLLGRRTFDCCVLDEAAQATEPVSWSALLRANRLVLAGDHFQLPPTILSQPAAAEGFNISLLERLATRDGDQLARRLEVQYRMHQDIMTFSSQEFYESSLTADPSVRGHLLSDLPGVSASDLTSTPIHFIDTAGASYDEELEEDGESRFNPQEADLVVRKVEALLSAGVLPAQIGVISPYAAQVRYLRSHIKIEGLEIDSVDGFQGREKEAILVSLVRSNRDSEIGFLADVRRMNVALTRARRKLVVIGDSATIAAHPFYQRLVNYFESTGAYHSVWEEQW